MRRAHVLVGLALIVGVLCALLDGSRAITAFPDGCTDVGGFATNCCRYAEPDAEFGTSACGSAYRDGTAVVVFTAEHGELRNAM